MATKITQLDIEAAVAESLTRKIPNASSAAGSGVDQEEWMLLRGKACRLFLSDPDARVYLYYLASNRLSSELRVFHALLCECVVLIESVVTATSKQEIGDSRKKARESLESLVAEIRRSDLTDKVVSRLKSATAAYLEPTARVFSRSNRLGRGDGAEKALAQIGRELDVIGDSCLSLLLSLLRREARLDQYLGEGARASILPYLAAALRAGLGPKEEILALGTSVGALEALSQPANTSYLVHTEKSFPRTLKVGSSDKLVFLETSGSVADPQKLGITTGCVIRSGGLSVNVTAISSSDVTTSGTLPKGSPPVIVQTAAQAALESFQSSLGAVDPYSFRGFASLLSGPRLRNINRPEANKMASVLAKTALSLFPLSAEAERSARILGISVGASGETLLLVRNFNPQVGRSSSLAVEEILDSARSAGLDTVVDSLTSADMFVLSEEDVSEKRRASSTASLVAQIMQSINAETVL